MSLNKGISFFWEIIKFVILALAIVIPIRYFIFQPFIVRGISMEPNFHDGEYLIVDELSYRFREPERGEVIIFRYPANPSEKFIKRIIGLPGERLVLTDDCLKIISQSKEEFCLNESNYIDSPDFLKNGREFKIAENQYFVMGDNRSHSFDSRNWGPLAEGHIIGRALIRPFYLQDIIIEKPSY